MADSDPNIIYVGMGEAASAATPRTATASTNPSDAGKTWTHVGLGDTQQIARMRVHPKNPDIVYVAALGHLLGPERRARRLPLDGRRQDLEAGPHARTRRPARSTWPWTRRIRASSTPAFWQVRRKPWTLRQRRPGQRPLQIDRRRRHVDGHLAQPGMPKGVMGSIGVTVSPANPERVWAIVEAEDGGVFRSDNARRDLDEGQRASAICASAPGITRTSTPTRRTPTRCTSLNVGFYKSNDGGTDVSAASARRTATTTISGSRRTIRSG